MDQIPEGGLPRKQVVADFGIGFSTLHRWLQQDRRIPEMPTIQSDLEREVAELRKENRILKDLNPVSGQSGGLSAR
ncbi:MAG: hypothetical protein AAGF71_09950 [Pseudomonadota bacterium]